MCEKFVKVSIFNNNRLSSMEIFLFHLFALQEVSRKDN